MTVALEEKRAWVRRFFKDTGSSYDAVVHRFTLGIDGLWKRKMLSKMGSPEKILDLACGTGILTFALRRKYPKCKIVGVDLSAGYLARAQAKANKEKVRDVLFVLSPAEDFFAKGGFDVVTTSYLPKYADLPRLIRQTHAMLVPGGRLVFHDFTYPTSRFLQRVFELYFFCIQPLGAWLYPEWGGVLKALPDVIRRSQWVPELLSALHGEGFVDITVESLTLQGAALVCARKGEGN